MLFVLTGKVQTGKTRWLQELVADLQRSGVEPCGALAPGVWADRRDDIASYPHADANGFEKLGIDNVLLPSDERIAFARRADLAESEGTYDPAIDCVNAHFASLRAAGGSSDSPTRFLVIDELGRLELERGEGLTEAIAMLEDGPAPTMPHALVVVREMLLPHLEGRFASWGETVHVHPDAQAKALILESVSESR